MSAVPKKKLCWNCEGNVSRELDNCPYCGVYVHALELEGNSDWNPSYHPSKTEEIPSPLYQIKPELDDGNEEIEERDTVFDASESLPVAGLYNNLKQDLFPILFLMMGSGFFLFGIILLLFSQNGTFTLQWQGRDGLYFLLCALPLILFGWKFLQQMEEKE